MTRAVRGRCGSGLFGVDATEYSILTNITKTFEPYQFLWESVSAWLINKEEWTHQQFLSIDPEKVENEVRSYKRKLGKSLKYVRRAVLCCWLVRRRAAPRPALPCLCRTSCAGLCRATQ